MGKRVSPRLKIGKLPEYAHTLVPADHVPEDGTANDTNADEQPIWAQDPRPLGPPLHDARRTAWFRASGLIVLAATVAAVVGLLIQHHYPPLAAPSSIGVLHQTAPASLPKGVAADLVNLNKSLARRGFDGSHRVVAAYGSPRAHQLVLLAAGEPAATSTNTLQSAVSRHSVSLLAISRNGVSYRCGHNGVTSLCMWRDGTLDGVLVAVPELSNSRTARLAFVADNSLLHH